MKNFIIAIAVIVLISVSCKSIGPRKINHDRFDYSQALANSWKKQMLLNIIKIRYLDLPIFLDVGQLVSGYSMETTVNVGGGITSIGGAGTIGASGKYTDRPTITYIPLTGERFLEGFLSPIQPVNIFSLLQSGYEADFVLEMCLDSFNGLYNRDASIASTRQPDKEFFKVIKLMRELQDAGGFGMKIQQPKDGNPIVLIFFRQTNMSPEILEKALEIRKLLGLPPQQQEFYLIYSPMQGTEDQIAVGSRSLWQILGAMSMGIVIPESHKERKLVPPLAEIGEDESTIFRVYSGKEKPDDVYVTVPFEGEWFWIANDDWRSKNTFSFILFLFTLADSGNTAKLPTITIPTY